MDRECHSLKIINTAPVININVAKKETIVRADIHVAYILPEVSSLLYLSVKSQWESIWLSF